jgi:hypothetical protein
MGGLVIGKLTFIGPNCYRQKAICADGVKGAIAIVAMVKPVFVGNSHEIPLMLDWRLIEEF